MNYSSLFIWVLAIIMLSCGDEQKPEELQVEADPIESKQKAEETGVSYYLVPTPNELFSLLGDQMDNVPKTALNPASNRSNYIDANSRALNFGVYATDLIYLSRAMDQVEVTRYFLTVKKMSEELGVSAAFDDKVFLQLESDVTAGDSLDLISLEAYYHAYDALEQNDKGQLLALLVTGGWVESMYLALHSTDEFEQEGELEMRIAEQKYTLDNLIDLNQQYKTEGSLRVVTMLERIRSVYDTFPIIEGTTQENSSSGRMVIGDQDDIQMDEAQYSALKEAIFEARASITLNKEGTES